MNLDFSASRLESHWESEGESENEEEEEDGSAAECIDLTQDEDD